MNLPQTIKDLVNAQNNFDGTAFSDCFSETAVVFDEGKTHTGKAAIKAWIEKAAKEYKAVMEPVELEGNDQKATLKAKVSGTFPGSPLILNYHFELNGKSIQSLKID
ncbi:nuclear transport factor 2 family protein [Flavobacterium panacagri]|uniref:nuclear transport factor 2 family protein n=1 Tax=Flavobacterium panacagri TaxID=3034146 RepID=UPI0025A56C1E|nr:nuclear transport factor 2 family protein [Flavobacterium panacagri]